MVLFEALTFVIGIVYGYASPGKEDKWGIFKTGLLVGLVLAVIFGLLGFFLPVPGLGLGSGFVSILISVIVLTIIFIVGVWIGDLLE